MKFEQKFVKNVPFRTDYQQKRGSNEQLYLWSWTKKFFVLCFHWYFLLCQLQENHSGEIILIKLTASCNVSPTRNHLTVKVFWRYFSCCWFTMTHMTSLYLMKEKTHDQRLRDIKAVIYSLSKFIWCFCFRFQNFQSKFHFLYIIYFVNISKDKIFYFRRIFPIPQQFRIFYYSRIGRESLRKIDKYRQAISFIISHRPQETNMIRFRRIVVCFYTSRENE